MEEESPSIESTTTMININRVHGYSKGSKCGYCGDLEGAATTGFSADQVTTSDYYKMLDRGFRRCGSYYYRPNLMDCCCCWYTIRGRATEHKIRKSHKKIMGRWSRYLAGERGLTTSNTSTGMEEEKKNGTSTGSDSLFRMDDVK